nr:putative leucine-rich repeat receptor-like protein kinase At2g19210 [Aegilops tauschii subsp. strangulata]
MARATTTHSGLSCPVATRKYLVRAAFLYGDYDGLGSPPVFDLHLGVNYWHTVNVSTPGIDVTAEAIVVVPDNFVQVCLVNTGAGTPFLSALELRPLKMKFYPQANLTQGLVLDVRLNAGPTGATDIVRYPEDPHDRVWLPWVTAREWKEISTTKQVDSADDDYEVPSAVMQTAFIPLNASMNLEFTWDPDPRPHDPSPGYFMIMHFSELQLLPSNALRQFDININGVRLSDDIRLFYLGVGVIYNEKPYRDGNYNISINATANSTLPPILNALELFSIMSMTNFDTDSGDVSAITTIKAKYHVQKNWMGDPCSPKIMTWEKLMCSYDIGTRPRIRSVGLNGDISSSFANLKALQYLDLSNNNLTGTIPDTLSQLPLLKILYGNNSNLCTNANSCRPAKMKCKLPIYVGAPTVVIVVIVQILNRIHHKNLVSLIGFCKDGEHMALVYEFMSEGSLQNHINRLNN